MPSAPDEEIGVLVAGTGKVGSATVASVLGHSHLRLAGAVANTAAKVGRDVGEVCGTGKLDITVESWSELPELLATEEVDVLCYCGLAESANFDDLAAGADAGVDVVSVAGPTHFATAFGDERAADLAGRAEASGARLVATGLNPGFLLDTLPVICASTAVTSETVRARRVSELGTWGSGVLDAFGIGTSPEEFDDPPHVSLRESLAAICDALQLEPEQIDEEFVPRIATSACRYGERSVAPGEIEGFELTCVASAGERMLVQLEWVGVVGADRGDSELAAPHEVIVEGAGLECRITGAALHDPYPATAARAANAIGPLRRLPAGIYSPAQLPISV